MLFREEDLAIMTALKAETAITAPRAGTAMNALKVGIARFILRDVTVVTIRAIATKSARQALKK